jgi:hypothetical protein
MFSRLKKLKEWLDRYLDGRKMFVLASTKLLSVGTIVFVDIRLKKHDAIKNAQLVSVSLRSLSIVTTDGNSKVLGYLLNEIRSIKIVDIIEKYPSNTLSR